MDFLGIPGLLEPDQVRALLHQRQASRRPTADPADEVAALRDGSSLASSGTELTRYEQLAVLRRELNGLVAAWHHRTGQPHGVTHADLRKHCGGPAAAVASADQLRARINHLREMAARRTS
jgi:predicted nucleic acid-binding Zn ribbon protein